MQSNNRTAINIRGRLAGADMYSIPQTHTRVQNASPSPPAEGSCRSLPFRSVYLGVFSLKGRRELTVNQVTAINQR